MTGRQNRSMPPGSVIPELAYEDVGQAAEWLSGTFGFRERLRIGSHRCRLMVGNGSVIVVESAADSPPPSGNSVMVRVDDADGRFEQARKSGAKILHPPTDYPFGQRQYTAQDPAGHVWTFSQSTADVDPADWGGVLLDRQD